MARARARGRGGRGGPVAGGGRCPGRGSGAVLHGVDVLSGVHHDGVEVFVEFAEALDDAGHLCGGGSRLQARWYGAPGLRGKIWWAVRNPEVLSATSTQSLSRRIERLMTLAVMRNISSARTLPTRRYVEDFIRR